jgi:hypothetical protein
MQAQAPQTTLKGLDEALCVNVMPAFRKWYLRKVKGLQDLQPGVNIDVLPSGSESTDNTADAVILEGEERGVYNFQPAGSFMKALSQHLFQEALAQEWRSLPKHMVLLANGENEIGSQDVADLMTVLKTYHTRSITVCLEIWHLPDDDTLPMCTLQWSPTLL